MLSLVERRKLFLEIWGLAYKKYSSSSKRLAGEGWDADWKLLLTTILSAQNRDEVTIPVAEALFKKFDSLQSIASSDVSDLKQSIIRINYNESKALFLKKTANILINDFNGRVPRNAEDLIKLPGVGIKTANLVIAELFGDDAICVDTHVHRISNVFGFVNTKTAEQTEQELRLVVPKKLWSKVNRIFVLWGQDVRGYDKQKFLDHLKN